MRLKRVRIFGFKTFADRTDIDLDGGIVAVVGPNGCGKSNLVDAILWALGESNARHLRAAANQDVIFSGSAKRRPVGFAEVTLLFDNEDGALPIDTPEVAVGRRLTRSGESEFFINRRACRQKDVHELFADSGLGRAGYAIVGQKEIDQALAASAEDRRAWVDEAAGVQRYRTRKIESTKRLASAREHLVRVDDILRELDSQREPLREEAEVARRYKAASEGLREVETGLLIQELWRASRDVADLERKLADSAREVRAECARAEDMEQQSRLIRGRLEEIDHNAETTRGRLQEAIAHIGKAESGIALSRERLSSLEELEKTLREQDPESGVAELERDLDVCRADESAEEQSLKLSSEEAAGAGQRAQELSLLLARAERDLQIAREAHARHLKEAAEREHRKGRLAELRRETQGIEADLPKLVEARQGAAAETEGLMVLFAAAEAALRECERQLAQLRQAEDDLGAKTRGLLAERAAIDGRRRGIEATISTHEGLAHGSKAVLEAVGKGELPGRAVPVGDAIKVDTKFAFAIETALGVEVNDLIVETTDQATKAVAYLKERRLGRATFHIADLAQPHPIPADVRELAGRPKVLGIGHELVTAEPWAQPVIERLLGSLVVVEDLETALDLSRTSGWHRIVTLSGEVVTSSGTISGGFAGKPHHGLVQRRADLLAAEREILILDEKLAATELDSQVAAETRQKLLTEWNDHKERLDIERESLNSAKDFLRVLDAEMQDATRTQERLAREIGSLSAETPLSEAPDLEAVQRGRDEIINELAGLTGHAERAKDKIREIESRLAQAHLRTGAAAKRLQVAKASQAARLHRLENLEPERERARQEIRKDEVEIQAWSGARAKLEAELAAIQVEKDAALQESIQLTEGARSAREKIAAMGESNHQAELSRARAELRRATSAEKLIEDYGITEAAALEQAPDVVVPRDAQVVASRLRREMKAMGTVNLGAIEAFERLSLRSGELGAQRADILEGIEQVEASMRELDALTRDRFMETYRNVEAAYAKMFQKLFSGGEAKLLLQNPHSVLDSGIEIEVTLPGKKQQRLELLSGGERALCAACFLFALLDVKPSPLVVLDEVDAPLDGRNVERFGDVLQEFTDRTQFIVITHNPTTIERAPVWLGVTMQEPGVSTLVPVRLPPRAAVVEMQEHSTGTIPGIARGGLASA